MRPLSGVVNEAAASEADRLWVEACSLFIAHPHDARELARKSYVSAIVSHDQAVCAKAAALYARTVMLDGAYTIGIALYRTALKHVPDDSLRIRADILNGIGWGYTEVGLKDKALAYIDSSLVAYTSIKDSLGIASTLNYKGYAYYRAGEYNLAEKAFGHALSIIKQTGDSAKMAAVLNNMSMYPTNAPGRIDMLNEAIKINQALGNTYSLAENYNNLGRQYFYAGRLSEANAALDKAAAYAKMPRARKIMSENHLIRAQILAAQKDYATAYSYLERKNELDEEIMVESAAHIDNSPYGNELMEIEMALDQKHNDDLLMTIVAIISLLTIVFALLAVVLWLKLRRAASSHVATEIVAAPVIEKDADELRKIAGLEHKNTNLRFRFEGLNKVLEQVEEKIRLIIKTLPVASGAELRKVHIFLKNSRTVFRGDMAEFEQDNNEFKKRLAALYPDISATESQVALMIRSGLSAKEIALVLGTAVKSVGMVRYRLRKRLGLDAEADLATFLAGI